MQKVHRALAQQTGQPVLAEGLPGTAAEKYLQPEVLAHIAAALARRNAAQFGFECDTPMDLQFDKDGHFYLLTYGDGFFQINLDAGMYRWDYVKGQWAPRAVLETDRTDGPVPLTVQFDGSDSSDPDPADALSFEWDFDGDGDVARKERQVGGSKRKKTAAPKAAKKAAPKKAAPKKAAPAKKAAKKAPAKKPAKKKKK